MSSSRAEITCASEEGQQMAPARAGVTEVPARVPTIMSFAPQAGGRAGWTIVEARRAAAEKAMLEEMEAEDLTPSLSNALMLGDDRVA